MNEGDRPLSQRSRQELLDEIYLLRDVAGEREQRGLSLRAELTDRENVIAGLKAELDLVYASRSWRWTTPLRAFARRLGAASGQAERSMATSPATGSASPDVTSVGRRDAARTSPTTEAVPRADLRHLFVDVTELSLREGRTGVQRVVREILSALLTFPPAGYVVEPVCASMDQPYRLTSARHSRESGNPMSFDSDALELPGFRLNGDDSDSSRGLARPPMDPHPGDVFLGLDHAMQAVIAHVGEFTAMRERGVRVWFICNDTLPLAHPEWFPPEVHGIFKQWFETIARVGDGIACISQATENDVRHWIDAMGIKCEQPLALGHFHLGADIAPGGSDAALTAEEQTDVARIQGSKAFLMVGTLEPRKGHAQALEAFNQLWASGNDVVLVIVGLPGWMTEVTQRRIRHHDEFGRRLFWYVGASDAMLAGLYSACTVLLAPSEGEGFGLPLIEAACHGLPILCRDLPVFREVAGDHASYFSGRDAASLATAVRDWLRANQRGAVPMSGDIRWLTWVQSARELLGVVLAAGKTGSD